MEKKELPRWASGQGSARSLLSALVQFLVGELRSHKLPISAKKKKKKKQEMENKKRWWRIEASWVHSSGTSLGVQWFRLYTSNVEGIGSI